MRAKRITLISLMTALTIIGAYITVPIPNLPFTLQTFFAMLAGLFLNKKDALISQIIYISLGFIGLPVFSQGGSGIVYIFRPSFGYIIGLPLIAYIISANKHRNIYITVFSSAIGLLIFGGVWFMIISKIYLAKSLGVLIISLFIIYIPIEIIKALLAILIWKRLKNIL